MRLSVVGTWPWFGCDRVTEFVVDRVFVCGGLTFSKIGIITTGSAMEANSDSSPMVIMTSSDSRSNDTILQTGSDC